MFRETIEHRIADAMKQAIKRNLLYGGQLKMNFLSIRQRKQETS